MTEEIKAIFAYTPRVKLGKMVEIEDIVTFIAGRTSINHGAILNILMEFKEALTFFALSGRPIRLKGLGIFAPKIDKQGVFSVNYKIEKSLKSELNTRGKYKGEVVNRDMIGRTVTEMVERWNQDHPGDTINT
jgi:hypothetical protein